MKKSIILFLLTAVILTGCTSEKNNENVAYTPVVCEYTTTPTCWTVIDCISTNIKIYDNNTVEVYCGDFSGRKAYNGESVDIDYIYGETFEITEAQKQFVIDSLKKNKISQIEDCSDEDSCDGSYSYIRLFDENGEKVHSCGGLNPYDENFGEAENAIFTVIPEGAFGNVRDKATEILINYLLENYPEEYDWLAEDYKEFT